MSKILQLFRGVGTFFQLQSTEKVFKVLQNSSARNVFPHTTGSLEA